MSARILTVSETAEVLRLSEHSVRRLIRAGRIPAFKLSPDSPWRIRRSDLDALIRRKLADVER